MSVISDLMEKVRIALQPRPDCINTHAKTMMVWNDKGEEIGHFCPRCFKVFLVKPNEQA